MPVTRYPKIVDSAHYHVWTDALHARELAKQAKNDWDRGTYVRWAITSAWTALEMVCGDALGSKGIGLRFKNNLDAAIKKNGLPSLNWGSGIWQRVAAIHHARKDFVHVNAAQASLFPSVEMADNAINDIRAAVEDLFGQMGKPVPLWVYDDEDPGWDKGKHTIGHAMIVRAGVDPGAPNTVRVGYVYKGEEHICDILPDGTNPQEVVNQLIQTLRVPVSRVRAYVGTTLVIDRELPMRGA
jgi:hypothetical protein